MKRFNFLRSAVTLAQGMRWLGLGVALICVGVAVWLWSQQMRVEPALRYTCDFRPFEVVTAECLEDVPVPVNRRFTVVSDPAQVTGQWATRPLSAGELVYPAHVTAQSPDRFRFGASGQELPVGMVGYYLAVPEPVLAVVQPDNLLTLSLADAGVRQLGVLLDQARILEQDEGGVFLGVTLPQVAALEGLLAELRQAAEEKQEDAVLVWTITQGENTAFPALHAFPLDVRQLRSE